ncbi:hypothetical protein BVRB_8g198700 [Beta vulgaris subsp. vulgaris]|nr:hypothetical protein BVRB_8g198700 [Beta vulgaris subsp. vulgaris]
MFGNNGSQGMNINTMKDHNQAQPKVAQFQLDNGFLGQGMSMNVNNNPQQKLQFQMMGSLVFQGTNIIPAEQLENFSYEPR